MGNFTLSEILTIVLVILIIFGPNRLPEMARKTGQWVAKARSAAHAIRDEFTAEYQDVVEPMTQVRDELRATRDELRGDVKEIGDDLTSAADATRDAAREVTEGSVTPAAPADTSPPAEEAQDPTSGDDA